MEKFQGRPFVIIGVNSDSDREKLKTVLQREKITWRSFWDGGSPNGPIARQWNVSGWPTTYLIDHEGKIIRPTAQSKKGDEFIEQKVQEAETALKK